MLLMYSFSSKNVGSAFVLKRIALYARLVVISLLIPISSAHAEAIRLYGQGETEPAAIEQGMRIVVKKILDKQAGGLSGDSRFLKTLDGEVSRIGLTSLFSENVKKRCAKDDDTTVCEMVLDVSVEAVKTVIAEAISKHNASKTSQVRIAAWSNGTCTLNGSATSPKQKCADVFQHLQSAMGTYGYKFKMYTQTSKPNYFPDIDYILQFQAISFSGFEYDPKALEMSGTLSVSYTLSNNLNNSILNMRPVSVQAVRQGLNPDELKDLVSSDLAERVSRNLIGEVNSKISSALKNGTAQTVIEVVYTEDRKPRERKRFMRVLRQNVNAWVSALAKENREQIEDFSHDYSHADFTSNITNTAFGVRSPSKINSAKFEDDILNSLPEQYDEADINFDGAENKFVVTY
ncbi:hypothetical protein V5T82_15085 [Magnetovibrio sp. PR-2]|uniref:hypothetical protein n=1 Tax=Magnetovibrio sp. PR-2 TaxID=3120356 RepID=UPI002FCDF500